MCGTDKNAAGYDHTIRYFDCDISLQITGQTDRLGSGRRCQGSVRARFNILSRKSIA